MKLVFFAHPDFLAHKSMPRFSRMLCKGMENRGHKALLWSPKAFFFKLPAPTLLKKWLGYIDQFILFPLKVKIVLRQTEPTTLFVFTDHALGPWLPMVIKRPHVVHCHDFLAQRSALGEFEENPVGWSGKQYQRIIQKGFNRGRHFISVSEKTQSDLHHLLKFSPGSSNVVYNGLHTGFSPIPDKTVGAILEKDMGIPIKKGFILHIGGNQWYKNRLGIIDIYDAFRREFTSTLPLLCVGEKPNQQLQKKYEKSSFKNDIYFLTGKSDLEVQNLYIMATVFLFPSLEEGFGWPIAEAMASGCPVVTTDCAPMTEVGGEAGFYIPRRPHE
ncbi:MAG: glycosyltransferase, partial [Bacteroidota bacterium]